MHLGSIHGRGDGPQSKKLSEAEQEMVSPTQRGPRVLFLCTGNSCRSQMAEAFARQHGLDAFSAGIEPAEHVHPLTIRVMAERGIDISSARPKHVDQFLSQPFDAVITVCGDAEERCPTFPGDVHREHWSLPDPAKATGSEEEKLSIFRRVRDEIESRMQGFLARVGRDEKFR